MPLLSVIIPVYNESQNIQKVIDKVDSVGIDKEIIVVDDGSDDISGQLIRKLKKDNLSVIHHVNNLGKGAAFLTGLSRAKGEFVIIQDADLETDPNDYLVLFETFNLGNADMVLGARFLKGRQGLLINRLGNKFLTFIVNWFFGAKINDYATCYKLARRSTFESLKLKSSGFDIDVEIICKALKRRLKIKEAPISYFPRSHKEGKKIKFKDAPWALFYMVKYRLT